MILQEISHGLARPEDYDIDARPRTPFQIQDNHEDKTDANKSVSPAGISNEDNSPECPILPSLSAYEMAPANPPASLGPTSSERDSTGPSESPSLSTSAEESEPAPLLFHELCLKTSNSAPHKPTTSAPNSSSLPSTLSPSMDMTYWLNRHRRLDNYGHFDTSTEYSPPPDTESAQGARHCIAARTLHKMTIRHPDLTSRPGSMRDYVPGTDLRYSRTAGRHGIELVAAQGSRPEITLTGCGDGVARAGAEIDFLSWEALGRPRRRGLLVYWEVGKGRKNVCSEEGGCRKCRGARRMNGIAMRAFGVGVDEPGVEKVEEGRDKGGEVVVRRIRKMVRLFGIGEGGRKRKEVEQRVASEKYRKMLERNIKEVNERRKREERKAEKKAKYLAKRTPKEGLKKEAKPLPGSKLPTPGTS